MWAAVSVSVGGFQELPTKVSEFRWGGKVARGWQEGGKRWEGGKGKQCQRRQRHQLLLLVSLTSCLGVWHEIKRFKPHCHQGGFEEVSKVEVVGWWEAASPPQAASVSRQPLRASAQGRVAGLPASTESKSWFENPQPIHLSQLIWRAIKSVSELENREQVAIRI